MKDKICTNCKISKPISEFYKQKIGKDGLRSECKLCHKSKNKEYHSLNKDKYRENSRKWSSNNKDAVRFYFIKRTYDITKERWLEMLKNQENKCAICSKSSEDNSFFYTDHCHDSKKVRGLLCRDCNLLLGSAKDNVNILEEAIKYLNNNK